MKPWIHAESSAKRFGGTAEDYIDIHNLMDSSKAAMGDSRHRALTHNTWFIGTIIERVFGVTIENSNGRRISTRTIAEQHVLEDYRGRFIPTAQDFLANMELETWMVSGAGDPPASFEKLSPEKKQRDRIRETQGSTRAGQ